MEADAMTLNLSSLGTATFWATLAGAASTICGALGYAHEGVAVNAVLIAIGGVFIGIVSHHTVKAAVAAKAGTPVPPVVVS
jgi:hypothetical protein